MHLCFPILWQLGRPVNHAFELNANSIYLSKTHASISLATAEPFQSLDLDHIIPIFFWERHIPHFKFGWEMQDWRSRTSRSSGTFHVAAARRWGRECEPWLSLKIEVQPTSLDSGGSDLWVWAVVFCCDSYASPLLVFPFVSENWFSGWILSKLQRLIEKTMVRCS